jgi:nucleoside triphosphate pyrophosphatase
VLVLASASPARLRVLRDAGLDPEVLVSGADESNPAGLDPAALTVDLARRKAAAVAALRPDALVLGCDSLLDVDGDALGKPASPAETRRMWARTAGREATLRTGHFVIDAPAGRQASGVASARVRFGRPTEAELAAYAASGEAQQLAGAFSIEARTAPFVESIDGHPSTVLGLSMPMLRTLLARLGYAMTDVWRDQA